MRLPVLTKIGPDAKEKGFIFSLKSVLHVGLVTCCVFAVLVLFCVQTKRAISSQTSRYGTVFLISHSYLFNKLYKYIFTLYLI